MSTVQPYEIDALIARVRQALVGRNEVVAAYLFGSVAAGTAHALSDMDVAILFRRALLPEAQFASVLEIGASLESVVPAVVDIVALNQAAPVLCFQVLKSGRLILDRDPQERSLFIMRALGRYYDEKPYIDYHNARLAARLQTEGLGRGYNGDRDALAEARRLSAKLAAVAKRNPE